MEGRTLMATVVALDASPKNVLRSLRGSISDARLAYPDVLHIEVHDSDENLWRFSTLDAEWSPSDPEQLIGRSIEGAIIDEKTGDLRLEFSDGSFFDVKPASSESDDDPPNWKLLTPDQLVLEFGPAGRWHVNRANEAQAPVALQARDLVKRRLAELDDERKQLERALSELGGRPTGGGSGRRHGQLHGNAEAASKSRRRSRKGTRTAQAVKLVEENPGITASEIARSMKIKPNYVYRILAELENRGRVAKKKRQYYVQVTPGN